MDRRLLAATLCVAALTGCHAPPEEPSPVPAVVLSTAGPAAQQCPVHHSRGIAVAPDGAIRAMHGFLPRLIPVGFGVLAMWRPGSGGRNAGVVWGNAKCQSFLLRLANSGGGSLTGERVAGWVLAHTVRCGNGTLEDVACFTYRARTNAGRLSLLTVGIPRPEADAVAASIPT